MEKKMTTRQIKAAQTRQKIVRAAKALIAEKGFDDTSIEDIAQKAGVSIGSFYTYFKKKEDVVEELNQTDFYRLAEIVNDMIDKDICERLKYYCTYFLADIEETGIEICRQWVRNNLTPTDMLLKGEKITKYKYDCRAMQSILWEAVNRKELKRDTPIDELALFINAQLYGLMVIWCMTDGEIQGSKETEFLCDAVVKEALAPYMQ